MSDPRDGTARLASRLLYSQCWEDVAVAREALRVPPGGTVLAIAAAGDNVLAMLQDDPARIIAVDLNPAQTALVQLKTATVRHLPDSTAVAAFLGAVEAVDRLETYLTSVRAALPEPAVRYWDAHPGDIRRGVIHAGRFERYVGRFRTLVLPLVPGRRTVRAMLAVTDLDAQRRIFREDWDTWRWRLLFRVFFSRALLRRFGRDPAFFEHAEIPDVGEHYLARAEHALMDIPAWRNPYLTYLLSGRFGAGDRLPDYLRPEVQRVIRGRLDRLDIRTADLDQTLRSLPSASVDAFYLSDVFELSTAEGHAATLAEIARVGRPGARICYWNNLVPRRRPDTLAAELASEHAEAGRLHAADRAFLYSSLIVERVTGGAA
jgi:S-adenosylmethionine-diacylglycerol 3-amino-3-carboxypropyl transferase